jgi:hypothetical protein
MLRQRDIADTLALGCEQGYFVLRLPRPDKSVRTFWRTRPTEVELKERDLVPEAAELTEIDSHLLAPGAIPGLWPADGSPLGVGARVEFFDGEHVSTVQKEGYTESFPIPKAPRQAVERAVGQAVKAGIVWLIAGPVRVFKEEVPLGVLNAAATLNPPPPEIAVTELLPQNLGAAWGKEVATAASASALSVSYGKPVPWPVIAAAIDGALRSRLLERTEDSGPWPCDWSRAAHVRLRVPRESPPGPPPTPPAGRRYAEAALAPAELQALVDGLGDILKGSAGLDLRFVLRIELDGTSASPDQMARLEGLLAGGSEKLRRK